MWRGEGSDIPDQWGMVFAGGRANF